MDSKRDSSASRNRSMSSNTTPFISPAKASMKFPLSNSDSAVEFAKNIIQLVGALGCIIKRHRFESLLVFFNKLRNIKNQNEKRKVGLCKCLNAIKAAFTRIKSTANQRIKEFAQVHPRKNNLLPTMRLNIFQTSRTQSQSIRKSPFTRGKGAELGKIKLIFNEMSADGITMSNLSHYNVTSFLTFNSACTKLTQLVAKKRKELLLHVFYHKLMKIFITTATPKRIFKMLKKRKIDEMALILQTLNSYHKDICHMQPSYYISDSESDESAFRSSGKKIAYYFPSCTEIEEDNEAITDPSPRRQVGAFIKRQEMLKKIINKRSLPSSVNNKQLEQFVNFERALLSLFRVFGRATSRQLSACMQEMHRKAGQRQAKQAVLKNLLNQYIKRVNQPAQRAFYTWLTRTSRDAHEGEFFFKFRQLIESHIRNSLREAFWRLRVSNLDKRYLRSKLRDSQIRAVSMIACFKRIRLNRLQISINKIKDQSARRKKECYKLLSAFNKIAMRNKLKGFHAIRAVGLKNKQASRVLLPILIRSYFTKNIAEYFKCIKQISNRKQQSIIYANRISISLTKITHRILRLPFSKLQNNSTFQLVRYHQHQHSIRQFAVFLAFLMKSIKLKHFKQLFQQLKSNNDKLSQLLRTLKIISRVSSKSVNQLWKEQIQQAFQKIKNISYKQQQNQRIQDIDNTMRMTKIFRFKDILAMQLIRRINLSFQKIKAITLKVKSQQVSTVQIILGVISSSVLRRQAQGFSSIQRKNQQMVVLKGRISQLFSVTGKIYSERKNCSLYQGFRAIEETAWMRFNQKEKLEIVIMIQQEIQRRLMQEGFNRIVQEMSSRSVQSQQEQPNLEGDQPKARCLFSLVTFLKRKMDLQLAGAFSELNLFVYKKNLQNQTAVFHIVQIIEKIICRRIFMGFSCLRVFKAGSGGVAEDNQKQQSGDVESNQQSRQFPEISGMLRQELERIVKQVQGDGASYSTQLIKLQEQINNLCSEQQNHFGSLHSAIKDNQNLNKEGQQDGNKNKQVLEEEQQKQRKDDQKEDSIVKQLMDYSERDQGNGNNINNGGNNNNEAFNDIMGESLTQMKNNNNNQTYNESVSNKGSQSQQIGSQKKVDNEDFSLENNSNNNIEKNKDRSKGQRDEEDMVEEREKKQLNTESIIQDRDNNLRKRELSNNQTNNQDSKSNVSSTKKISNDQTADVFPQKEEESTERNSQNYQPFAQERKEQQKQLLQKNEGTKEDYEDKTLQDNNMNARQNQSDLICQKRNGINLQKQLAAQGSSSCSIDPLWNTYNNNGRGGFSEKSIKGGENTEIPKVNVNQLGQIDYQSERQQSSRDKYSENIDVADPVIENRNENNRQNYPTNNQQQLLQQQEQLQQQFHPQQQQQQLQQPSQYQQQQQYNQQQKQQQQQQQQEQHYQQEVNNSLIMKKLEPQGSSKNINNNINYSEENIQNQNNSQQQVMPFQKINNIDQPKQQQQSLRQQEQYEGISNKMGDQIVKTGKDNFPRNALPAVQEASQQSNISKQKQEEQENGDNGIKPNQRQDDEKCKERENVYDEVEQVKRAQIPLAGKNQQNQINSDNNNRNNYQQNLDQNKQQPEMQFINQKYQQIVNSSPASQLGSDLMQPLSDKQQQQQGIIQNNSRKHIGVNYSENDQSDPKSNSLLRNQLTSNSNTPLIATDSMDNNNESLTYPLSQRDQSKQLSRQGSSSNTRNLGGFHEQIINQTGQLIPQVQNKRGERIDMIPQEQSLGYGSANQSPLEEQQQYLKNNTTNERDTQVTTSRFPSNPGSPYNQQQQQQMPRAENGQQEQTQQQQQGQQKQELGILQQIKIQSQERQQQPFDNSIRNYNSNNSNSNSINNNNNSNSNRSNYNTDRFDQVSSMRKTPADGEEDQEFRKGQIVRKTASNIFPNYQITSANSNQLKNLEPSEQSLNIPQIITGCGLISYLPINPNNINQSQISQEYQYPQNNKRTTSKDQQTVISSSPHQYKYSSPGNYQDPSLQQSINHLSPITSDDLSQIYSTGQNLPQMAQRMNVIPGSNMQTFGNHRNNMLSYNNTDLPKRQQVQDNIDIDGQLDMFQQHLQRIKLQLQQASKTEDSPSTARNIMKKQLFSHRETQRQREGNEIEEGYESMKYAQKPQGGKNIIDGMRNQDNSYNRDYNEDIVIEQSVNNQYPSQFNSQSNQDQTKSMQSLERTRRNINQSSDKYYDTPAGNSNNNLLGSQSQYYQSNNPYGPRNNNSQKNSLQFNGSNDSQSLGERLNNKQDNHLEFRSAEQFSRNKNNLEYQLNYQSIQLNNPSRLDYQSGQSINSINTSKYNNEQGKQEKRNKVGFNNSQMYAGDDQEGYFQPASFEPQSWRKEDRNYNNSNNNNHSDVQQFIASRRQDRPRPRQTLDVEILEDD